MDGVIVIMLTVALYVIYHPQETQGAATDMAIERVEESPMLNPEMIHDSHAFMEIANELGFH